METGFIVPIQAADTIGGLNQAQKTSQAEGSNLFKDIFQNAVDNVKRAEANHEQQMYLLATGQLEDGHTVTIAAAEAMLASDLLVQLRNKAVEVYNELMRITV